MKGVFFDKRYEIINRRVQATWDLLFTLSKSTQFKEGNTATMILDTNEISLNRSP